MEHANGKRGNWSDWHSEDIFQQDKLSKLRTFEQQGTAKRHYIFTFQVIWLCTAELLIKLSKEKSTLTVEPSIGLHLVRRERGHMCPSVPDLATFPTFPLLSFLECKHFECREELGSVVCSEQFPALWALRTFLRNNNILHWAGGNRTSPSFAKMRISFIHQKLFFGWPI